MPSQGIMKEIRSLLDQGKSSAEIIAMGFNPSTVYKAQRQLRQESRTAEDTPGPSVVTEPVPGSEPQEEPELEEKANQPVQQADQSQDQTTEILSLREELAQALDRIASLEAETREVDSLRERVADLEPKASSAEQWQVKYHDLEDRLGHVVAGLRREVEEGQRKLAKEQEARKEAEAAAALLNSETARLKGANRELRQKLQSLPNQLARELWEVVQPLNAELEELRRLKG